MAVPSDTVQTFAMIGIREQLSDTISNVDPMETPFYSATKKGTCKNRTPEWILDTHRSANADNATIEGDDATNNTFTTPSRVKNVVQLFDGVVQVSTTAEAVDVAGRSSEMAYQIAKEGKAIRTDIEKRMSGNYASVIGASGTAGKFAGFEAWITTNDSRGSGGSQGGWNAGTGVVDAATDGSTRALTETIFKASVKQCWTNGAKAPKVLASAAQKQVISGFSGIATRTLDVTSNGTVAIMGAADVYVSDFGRHSIMPSRFVRDASVLLVDPEYWELAFLQPFKTEPLAKTGHSIRRMISAELTLKSKNEKANAIIADLS